MVVKNAIYIYIYIFTSIYLNLISFDHITPSKCYSFYRQTVLSYGAFHTLLIIAHYAVECSRETCYMAMTIVSLDYLLLVYNDYCQFVINIVLHIY